MNTEIQQRLYNALVRISKYDSPKKLRRDAEREYGLTPDEALELAYENVIQEAKSALKGVRKPK